MNAALQAPAASPSPSEMPAAANIDDEREEIVGALSQYNWNDYLLALPITLLALFALGILIIDLLFPAESKWINAVTALSACCSPPSLFARSRIWMKVDPHEGVGVARHDAHACWSTASPFTFLSFPGRHGHLYPHVGAVHGDRARKPRRILLPDAALRRWA